MKFHTHYIATAVLGFVAASQAGAGPLSTSIRNTEMSVQAAWSDADYANAKTMTPKVNFLPQSVYDLNGAAEAAAGAVVKADVAGARGGADARHLHQMRVYQTQRNADDGMSTEAVGTGAIQFTSTRVFPNQADTTFPTRAVGKLYFRNSAGASYMCSGSMVKPGIVVTAGHCIHNGAGSFYNSFQFIPGYRKVGAVETRPYGTWTNWAYARTTTDWVSGGGTVPNLRDWAIIVFNKDASGKRIGDYTGHLGYQYPAMIGKQVSVLGYPGNLDLGGQLHQIASLVTNYGTNNGTWGSDMEGGSSGGPVVLNFRKDYTNSSTAPSDNNGNRVTSVVSWGYVSTAPKVQGGSQFDSVFGTMISDACTSYAFAC